MLMDVSRALRFPGQPFPFEQALEIEPTTVLDDPVAFSDVRLKGVYTGVGESVEIIATLTARVTSRCARCLEPVDLELRTDVDELFARPDPARQAEERETYPLDGSRLDLKPMAEEALLLELPIRFLCREDCKGICHLCGANLNVAPCTCPKGGTRQNPFQALSELLTENEEV